MRNPKGCWVQCAVAALMVFCTIGLNINAFSVYIPYLTQLLELNPNQSAGILMVRNLFSVGAVYLARYYYDKLDIRWGYTLALLLSSVALVLYARASGFVGVCAAAAFSGISYGLGGMYPVALLIHRWFSGHESLAMGICASTSGLAITVGAPVITRLVETVSLPMAMHLETGFFLLCTLVCFLLLRNYPDGVSRHTHCRQTVRHALKLNGMFFAVVALGIMGGALSFLTLHYTTEGFDPYRVSAIVSVIGALLIGAKFLLGELFDVWGSYRTNWLFFSAAVIGCLLFCLGGVAGYIPTLAAAFLYGIGASVTTVGIATYAKDLSRPEEFEATQQQYQFASLLGTTVCALLPGPVATVTGNYRGFFVIVTGVTLFAAIVIQGAYRKVKYGKHTTRVL